MTLASQDNRVNYTATGDPATTYAIPFYYNKDETWVEVYVDDVLEPTAGYTVDTNNDTVKFKDGDEPESGKTITLFRSVPLDQEADYTAFGKFPSESHERALDKLTAIAQQMLDSVQRSLKVAVSLSTGIDIELPAPAAKNAIRWNDTEDGFENFEATDLGDLVLGDNEIAYKIPGGIITGLVLGEHQFVGRLPGGNIKALTREEVRRALGDTEHATDSGTDAFVSATNTTPPGDGVWITRDFQSANTTTTPTLDGKTITDRDGNALWAGAINGEHSLQYASGTDTYLLLDPRPIDEDDMASDSVAAVPTQQSVKAYALTDPGTSSDPSLAFDTWRTPNANRPTLVEVRAQAGTDGASNADVFVLVDESGGTTSDYTLQAAFAHNVGGSGFNNIQTCSFTVPAGASYQIQNSSDPDSRNAIFAHREYTP